MPVCAAVCDFFTDGAAVCTNMQTATALLGLTKKEPEKAKYNIYNIIIYSTMINNNFVN